MAQHLLLGELVIAPDGAKLMLVLSPARDLSLASAFLHLDPSLAFALHRIWLPVGSRLRRIRGDWRTTPPSEHCRLGHRTYSALSEKRESRVEKRRQLDVICWSQSVSLFVFCRRQLLAPPSCWRQPCRPLLQRYRRRARGGNGSSSTSTTSLRRTVVVYNKRGGGGLSRTSKQRAAGREEREDPTGGGFLLGAGRGAQRSMMSFFSQKPAGVPGPSAECVTGAECLGSGGGIVGGCCTWVKSVIFFCCCGTRRRVGAQ